MKRPENGDHVVMQLRWNNFQFLHGTAIYLVFNLVNSLIANGTRHSKHVYPSYK